MSEKEYVESLARFLTFSCEDKIVIDGILKQLPAYASSTLEDLRLKGYGRIIDIGSGNGAKAIYLAHRLRDLGINVIIDSLEPKAEQRARLAENYQGENINFLGAVYGITLGDIQISGTYDLVLVIHSLYEFPRNHEGEISSLGSLGHMISERGAGILIIEHPEGDLQKMKRELYPSFGKKMPISRDILLRSLQTACIPYTLGDTIEVTFYLDKIINEHDAKIGKTMSFLFSDSLDDRSLTDNEYCTVGRWVKANARHDKKNHAYLWTPDGCVWIYRRPSRIHPH